MRLARRCCLLDGMDGSPDAADQGPSPPAMPTVKRRPRPWVAVGSIVPFVIALFVALWFAPTASGIFADLGGPAFRFVPIGYLALACATAGGCLAYRRRREGTSIALIFSMVALAMDAAIILYFYWWIATPRAPRHVL